MLSNISRKYRETALIKLIAVGLIIGIFIALYAPAAIPIVAVLGDVFVRALKGVAPILVFVLVMNAMAQRTVGSGAALKPIVRLYVIATFLASVVAVAFSFAFPSTLHLVVADATVTPPSGIIEVVHNLILNVVDNPLHAIANANYIGILAWSILAGIALQKASPTTKNTVRDFAVVMTQIVLWVIRFAPFGIMGLVYAAVSTSGLEIFTEYGRLIVILVAVMFFIALVTNPIIVAVTARINPYPLVLRALRDSAVTAFFTRSSAANIPVNMELCRKLKLDENNYSVSIPLGATINMAGAAVTITVMAMAAHYTMTGTFPDIPTAVLLSALAAIGAAGASGVPGGSLLLIPLACSLFGIDNDIAMQVVAVGFIIGVVQDSCETALNSSSDVVLTATAEYREWKPHRRLRRMGEIAGAYARIHP